MKSRTEQDIIDTIKDGEPIDFATLNFDNKETRERYRDVETWAFDMIASRECMFCFDKANENGMEGLGEIERVGYAHTPCMNAFYEVGFTQFKLYSAPNSELGYYFEISTEDPFEMH